MFKRFLSIFITITMLLTILPVIPAHSAEVNVQYAAMDQSSTPSATPSPSPTPSPTWDIWQDFRCELPDGETAPSGGISVKVYSLTKGGSINCSGTLTINSGESSGRLNIWMYPPMEQDVIFRYTVLTLGSGYVEEGVIGQYHFTYDDIVFTLQHPEPPTSPPTSKPTSQPSTLLPTETPVQNQTPTPVPGGPFTDLGNVEWAQEAISDLAALGVINGYGDGTFRPDNNITRSEFIKMYCMAFGFFLYDQPDDLNTKFKDVPKDSWYIQYLISVELLGLVQGDGDDNFRPEDTITREEMFIFCARAVTIFNEVGIIDKDSPEVAEQLGKFTDGSMVNEWAENYVATIVKGGLVSGVPAEGGYALNPQAPITRAEVAVVLYRAIKHDGGPTQSPTQTSTQIPTQTPTQTPAQPPEVTTTPRASYTPAPSFNGHYADLVVKAKIGSYPKNQSLAGAGPQSSPDPGIYQPSPSPTNSYMVYSYDVYTCTVEEVIKGECSADQIEIYLYDSCELHIGDTIIYGDNFPILYFDGEEVILYLYKSDDKLMCLNDHEKLLAPECHCTGTVHDEDCEYWNYLISLGLT